jgi:hypothetical protein
MVRSRSASVHVPGTPCRRDARVTNLPNNGVAAEIGRFLSYGEHNVPTLPKNRTIGRFSMAGGRYRREP